jgi:AcrR family transcriptional regulator
LLSEAHPALLVSSCTNGIRQRLLAEAQRLFREHGYAATSLEQIAEAAEVTKGAIYGHFASKEDLMLYLCREHAREAI